MARWQFWIDRGGTFTDCVGFDPDSRALRVTKVLSSDEAPLLGIRKLLGLAESAPIPACDVRMGTTLATNALLERRGVPTALVISEGFADLLAIGDQTRPDLFALAIEKPSTLHTRVVETSARATPDGRAVASHDGELEARLRALAGSIESLAVVVMHDYAAGEQEQAIAQRARSLGFAHVVCSHEVSPRIGLLARAETTVVDAYLTPLLVRYLALLAQALPGSSVRMMQSSGGLTPAARFRGRDAVLSGPAGGAVALRDLSRRVGGQPLIGFDMGGTSTDVSRCAGELERVFETRIAGVRLRTPMLSIHTIAAGGGSLCRFDGRKLSVGPESAGALPGPLCYGHADAREPALTDVHLVLGRLADDYFPFTLAEQSAREGLEALAARVEPDGDALRAYRVAEGLFEIAVENMAEAIRRVTIGRGHDVRQHALAVFGGAGGQAACAVARKLGIRQLLFHPLAGVLSAYGMGVADETWHGERDLGASTLDARALEQASLASASLIEEAGAQLRVLSEGKIEYDVSLELRYAGTEATLVLAHAGEQDALRERFHAQHAQRFGYARREHVIELVGVRVEGRLVRSLDDALPRLAPQQGAPERKRLTRLFRAGAFVEQVPVYDRARLGAGARIEGPALLLDPTGTLALDAGFVATLREDGILSVDDVQGAARAQVHAERDPVLLEVFNNLFMSIAEQMGEVLKRTALSTNIRERMDFSCAVFDAQGGLVANAPHIPVHLGAMSESVKAVLAAHPNLKPGDVFVTNDPALGGSHLPDVTVVSPVHDDNGVLRFVSASRGHHADIGGIAPGSMPAESSSLAEEGVVLSALRIVEAGHFDRDGVRAVLTSGTWPARNPDENLADLEAQIAANHTGARLLGELAGRFGHAVVASYMQHIQDNAAEAVAALIAELGDGERSFTDALDDGSVIQVAVSIAGGRMTIDFAGSAPEHAGNLNAPRAVTVAAVLYVLRCLVGKPIPLNSGCLRAIELRIPERSLLSPSPERAVVAGNVETSQRVVDVLLGALGAAAASQGTMNNFTFGSERFGYYETIAGGAGATAYAQGADAVHTHMTNTRITDPEILERRFPVRLVRFAVRDGSGGAGRHRGGHGVVRELELLEPLSLSFVTERRVRAPFGLDGGGEGARGRNTVDGVDVGGRTRVDAARGARVCIETPGGGGYGS
ncbi:MAG: hydantoinase B/oxoprolinase family protein [Polyangiales bacterium]